MPAFKPEELGSLHTLNDVARLVESRTPQAPVPTNQPTPGGPQVRDQVTTSPVFCCVQLVGRQTASPDSVPVSCDAGASLTATVLSVVSEKTGYPTEMLNLEMSLDHDLGIDSIKRVEILSALQERVPDLPAFKPEELGALHTLKDVAMLAQSRSADLQTVNRLPSGVIASESPRMSFVASSET